MTPKCNPKTQTLRSQANTGGAISTRWKYGNRAHISVRHCEGMAKENENLTAGPIGGKLLPVECPTKKTCIPTTSNHLHLRTMPNNYVPHTRTRAPIGRICMHFPTCTSLWTPQNVWDKFAKSIYGTNGGTHTHATKILQPTTRSQRVPVTSNRQSNEVRNRSHRTII